MRASGRFNRAGRSAEREFSRRRRQNIRDAWGFWLLASIGVIAFAGWSVVATPVAGRLLAGVSGAFLGVMFVLWALGGHVSAFHWWVGAQGERDTAREIERLGDEWHCEHDLEHDYGNWDHVLVGPAGVFLLDSKVLHNTGAAGRDALSAGRLRYAGAGFRSGARRVKLGIEERLGSRAPWVQAVVVVWGDFPQGYYEEQDVVYLSAGRLVPWLSGLPEKLNAPWRAAVVTALQQVRASAPRTPSSTRLTAIPRSGPSPR
ncbi:MAG TPA: nuclease-related domain-containing protein [Gaiellaceae bacterium]|nr:nuclease-related domain-containing protein [Gaiellaceae bacterium]